VIVEVDYKKFQKLLNEKCPSNNYTEKEAAEAFHNLADFVKLLMDISERQTKERKEQAEIK